MNFKQAYLIWMPLQLIIVLTSALFGNSLNWYFLIGLISVSILVSLYCFYRVLKSKLRGIKQLFWAVFALLGFAGYFVTAPFFYYFVLNDDNNFA